MKILLIRPENSSETIGLQHLMIVEPLELEVIAASIRPCDEIQLIDMVLEKNPVGHFIERYQPDLVGVTGYVTHVDTMTYYCSIAKRFSPAIKTVVGGVHCEVCPEDFEHPSVDFRAVRNAAINFPQFLDHLDSGKALPSGYLRHGQSVENTKLPPFDFDLPFPDRRITERYRHNYFYIFQDKIALIKASFGCPFTCSFCFCWKITNGHYHARPIQEVLKELSMIREKEIYIVDDDFLVSRSRLWDFIQGIRLKGIHKHYLIYGRADFIAKNPGLMKAFKDVGLRTVIVGFESFSDDELAQFQKNTSAQTNRQAMHILNRLGISCFATLIISPDWEVRDFDHMIREVRDLGIHFVNLQPLTPLPGTGFPVNGHDVLIKRNDYQKWDLAHIALQPTKMSMADFYRQIVRAYEQILFQPHFVWECMIHHSWKMLLQMIKGSARVHRQYRQKIQEALNNA